MNTQEKYQAFVNTAFMTSIEPIVIERAKGATYTDDQGRSFLDCFSGISVVNAGHGNEAIIGAAKEQMEKLVHCSSYFYHVKAVADLAEKLAGITPGKLKKSFFGNGGAEAVEGAIRLAKRFTKKNEMVALSHSFHGRTYATLSLTGNATRKKGGGPYMPGVAFAPAPYCYRCPFKYTSPNECGLICAEYVEDVVKFHSSDNVAFFIAEPVMGEGGIIVPPPDYFKVVKQILDQHDILFIADEVQSGFGRTGKMFGIEHYSVEPDIMVMGKAIANGFPLSCFIAREEIADSFKPGDHLTTFGGNPVSCAASLASINFLEENDMPGKTAQKGEFLRENLLKISPNQVAVGEVRGKGLMMAMEIVKDKESKTPAANEAGKIRVALRENGVLIGLGGVFGNVLRIQPPLTITEEELEKLIGKIKEVVES